MRLPAAALLALALAGCGPSGASRDALPRTDHDVLATTELLGFGVGPDAEHRITDATDERPPGQRNLLDHAPWLSDLRSQGALGGFSRVLIELPKQDPVQVVSLAGIRDGSVSDAWLAFEPRAARTAGSMGGRTDPMYGCIGAIYLLRSGGRGQAEAMHDLGLALGQLWAVDPVRRLAAYATDRADWTALVGVDGDRPILVGLARGNQGILQKMGGWERWSMVKKRVDEAVRNKASLDQVQALAETLAIAPLPTDRAEAGRLLAGYGAELSRQMAAIEAAWPTAGTAARVPLVLSARILAKAGRMLPDAAARQARAVQMTAEVDAAAARLAEAAGNARPATASGWSAVRQALAGSPVRPPAIAALTTAIVPSLAGDPAAHAEDLFGDAGWMARRPVAVVAGWRPGGPAAWTAAARRTLEVVVQRPAEDRLSVREMTMDIPHAYSVVNRAWLAWSATLGRIESALAAARSEAANSANYTTTETYYVDVPDGVQTYTSGAGQSNGRTYVVETTAVKYRKEARTRTVTNEAMRARHEAATAEAARLDGVLADHRASEPPQRLPRQALVSSHQQVWSGGLERALRWTLDGQAETAAQAETLDRVRNRHGGWRSDEALPAEHLPPTDEWQLRPAVVAELTARLDAALPRVAAERLDRAIADAIAALPDADERTWARWWLLGVRDTSLPLALFPEKP
jgi:hypothetical protein